MSSLKKAVRLSLSGLTLLYASLGYAWSKQGHEAITSASISMLSVTEQKYYLALAALLTKPNKQIQPQAADVLNGDIGMGIVAVLGSFPDNVRHKSLAALFNRYGEAVPKQLLKYRDKTTDNWHYHNVASRNKKNAHCDFVNRGKLLDILKILDVALKSPISKQQEALLVSFQIHLIQDIHQPLHTLTKLDDSCEHDLGGNRTCVVKKKTGSCEPNLHRYWDAGFGVFDQLEIYRSDFSYRYIDLDKFHPVQWVSENNALYDHVYQQDKPKYFESSKALVQKRVSIAVKRLAYYLESHFAYVQANKK
ncbi:MAG: hypothetical protein K6L80_02530 [Agarilytica sp.]